MIAIIDYGMGNLRSVAKAIEYLGQKPIISDNPQDIINADKIILPGVGAFKDAIERLQSKKLDKLIKEVINNGKPFLGICLGMQLLFEKSFEDGEYDGLGVLKGQVKKFENGLKVPHIGWNELEIVNTKCSLFNNLPDKSVYFVHSYYVETEEKNIATTTEYGHKFVSAVCAENVWATQFHPEKSGDTGLKMLENFIKKERQ